MDEVLLRFPHLGKQIFEELHNQFLTDCRIVDKLWKNFIHENKIVLYKIVKKYTNCKESSLKKFCSKANVETIANQSMKDYEEFKINQSKFAGYTLLHATANNGHLLNCELMIENLLDKMPKVKDLRWKISKEDCGMTPFHLAASKGHLKICELF
jgi:ankyrin repeat protein